MGDSENDCGPGCMDMGVRCGWPIMLPTSMNCFWRVICDDGWDEVDAVQAVGVQSNRYVQHALLVT